MKSIKPIYLILLVVAILFVALLKITNPYREYGTMNFWQKATIESVTEIPDEALKPGNKNGPVLMWAAMASNNPDIIKALVKRGADVNEADGNIFKGTPLTGAASRASNPEVIEQLIELGADIDKRVNNDETALMIAARFNHNPGIATTLVKLGSNPDDKNSLGISALDYAKLTNNETVLNELKSFKK